MTVLISKPAINLREELASLRNQGGLPKEDKLYVGDFIQNGDFSADSAWIKTGDHTAISNGTATIGATSGNGSIRQENSLIVGNTYILKLDITAVTSTAAVLVLRNDQYASTSSPVISFGTNLAVTTYSRTFVATGSTVNFTAGGGNSSITIDNISVQEVGKNLVTNGTFDTDSGWTPSSAGAASGISNGQAYLESSGGNARLSQNVNLEAGKTYTIQFDLISQAGFGLSYVRLGTSELLPINSVSIGKNSGTFVANSANNLYFGTFANNGTSFTIDNVILTEGNHQVIQSIPYGYDVKDVYIDGELAREGEAYDYEVKTDGINQWLKPSVEPTATTETVVIGVRK